MKNLLVVLIAGFGFLNSTVLASSLENLDFLIKMFDSYYPYNPVPEHKFRQSSSKSTYVVAFEVLIDGKTRHLTIAEDYLDFYDRKHVERYTEAVADHLEDFLKSKPSLKVKLRKYDFFGRNSDLPVAVVAFDDQEVHEFFASVYEHGEVFQECSRFKFGSYNSRYTPHITIGERRQSEKNLNDPFAKSSFLDLSNAVIYAAIKNDISVDRKNMNKSEIDRRVRLRRNERISLFSGGKRLKGQHWVAH